MQFRTIIYGVRMLAISALIAGCSINEPTKQSLVAYTAAMEQVHVATDQFLVDYAAVDKLKKDLQMSLAGGEEEVESYPSTYDPSRARSVSSGGVGRDIQARRDALNMVASYNGALVALAQGQSDSEISGYLSSFGSGVGSVLESLGGSTIPGLSAVIPLASQFAELIQDGLNRKEFENALDLGQPLVEAILKQLEDDTTAYYEASVVVTNNDRDSPNADIRTAAFAIRKLAADHAKPTDMNLQNEVTRLQRELTSVGRSTHTSKLLMTVLSFTDGKPAYDDSTHRQVLIHMQTINDAAKVDAQLVTRQNAYYDLMGAYVVSIRQTKASLASTRANLEQPANIEAEASRLLGVALDLRDAFFVYKTARQ